MKLVFNRKDFLEAINIGGCYAGNRKVLPILECVKITVKNNKCTILSYDDMNAIKTSCNIISSDEDIVFCINKADIESYVNLLRDETFEMKVEVIGEEANKEKKMKATIYTDTGTMEFPVEDAKWYPTLQQESDAETFTMPAQTLGYWIVKGNPFLKEDELQPVFECLHLFIQENNIHAFAFDSIKMYHDFCETESNLKTILSIPRNSFKGIREALKKENEVTIKNGKNNIIIKCENSMLLIRKMEMKVPNFFQLLQYKDRFTVRVDKRTILLCLLKAINIFEKPITGNISLSLTEEGITISATNWGGNKNYTEKIYAEGGQAICQNFNAIQMRTAIDAISTDNIEICPTGERALLKIKNPEYDSEVTMICPMVK